MCCCRHPWPLPSLQGPFPAGRVSVPAGRGAGRRFPVHHQGASALSSSGSHLSGRLRNLENLTLPFVMSLALPEKEKLSDLFLFTSDWHLTGCLPGQQAATALLWEYCECLHWNRARGHRHLSRAPMEAASLGFLGGERPYSVGSEHPLEGKSTGFMLASSCCLRIQFKFMHFYKVVRA